MARMRSRKESLGIAPPRLPRQAPGRARKVHCRGYGIIRRIPLAPRPDPALTIADGPPIGPRVPLRPTGRGLARNTAFSFAQQAGAMGLALLLVPYMLWVLGPERYGLWLTLQLFNILGLAYLAELGFQGAIVRYLARFHATGDHAAFRGVMAGGFWLFCGLGVVVGSAVILFANSGFVGVFPIPEADKAQMQLAFSVVGAGLFAGFPALAIKAYYAGKQELAVTKVWELTDRVIFALGVVVILQFTTNLVALVLLEQVLGLVLALAFGLRAAWQSPGWFTLRPGLPMMGHFAGVVRMSRSVFALNLASQGFVRLPDLFVGALLGPVSLTAYQLATRIPRVIKTLQGSLNAAILPHVTALDATEGDGERGAFVLAGLRANYIVATPLLVAAAVLAPVLLELWVGAEYRALAGYMAAFAGFQALLLASSYAGATLVRQEHLGGFVRFNLLMAALFLGALALGLERFGLGGLFAALLIAGVALFAGGGWVLRRAHAISLRQLLHKAIIGPVLVSGLMGGAMLAPGAVLLGQSHWIGGSFALLAGALLYGLALYRLVLSPEERARLERLRKGFGRG